MVISNSEEDCFISATSDVGRCVALHCARIKHDVELIVFGPMSLCFITPTVLKHLGMPGQRVPFEHGGVRPLVDVTPRAECKKSRHPSKRPVSSALLKATKYHQQASVCRALTSQPASLKLREEDTSTAESLCTPPNDGRLPLFCCLTNLEVTESGIRPSGPPRARGCFLCVWEQVRPASG